MNDCEGVRDVARVFGRVVVVGDDEVYAECLCVLSLVCCGDAAIDGDDELCAGLCDGRERVGVEAVALVEAVGDVGGDLRVGRD